MRIQKNSRPDNSEKIARSGAIGVASVADLEVFFEENRDMQQSQNRLSDAEKKAIGKCA